MSILRNYCGLILPIKARQRYHQWNHPGLEDENSYMDSNRKRSRTSSRNPLLPFWVIIQSVGVVVNLHQATYAGTSDYGMHELFTEAKQAHPCEEARNRGK